MGIAALLLSETRDLRTAVLSLAAGNDIQKYTQNRSVIVLLKAHTSSLSHVVVEIGIELHCLCCCVTKDECNATNTAIFKPNEQE